MRKKFAETIPMTDTTKLIAEKWRNAPPALRQVTRPNEDWIKVLGLVGPRPGLGNVLHAGHMRPSKHLNVSREHIFRLIEVEIENASLNASFQKMEC
jgi:hypothetical protein